MSMRQHPCSGYIVPLSVLAEKLLTKEEKKT